LSLATASVEIGAARALSGPMTHRGVAVVKINALAGDQVWAGTTTSSSLRGRATCHVVSGLPGRPSRHIRDTPARFLVRPDMPAVLRMLV
jgi:hypothetical protein